MKVIIGIILLLASVNGRATSCRRIFDVLTQMVPSFTHQLRPNFLERGIRHESDIQMALQFLADLEGEEGKKLIAAAKKVQFMLSVDYEEKMILGKTDVDMKWYLDRTNVDRAQRIHLYQCLRAEAGNDLQSIYPSIFTLKHELTHAAAFSDLSRAHFQEVTWPQQSRDFYSLYQAFYYQGIFDEVRALESEIFLEQAYLKKYGESLALKQTLAKEREHILQLLQLYQDGNGKGQKKLLRYVETHYIDYKINAAQLALFHFFRLPLDFANGIKRRKTLEEDILPILQQKLRPHLSTVEFDWAQFSAALFNPGWRQQDYFLQEKFDQHLQIINQVLAR